MIPLISHATEPNSPSLIENAAIESAEIPRKRICFVTAAPSAINAFLRSHINALKIDYDIILISSGSAKDLTDLLDKHVSFISLRIERKISIKNDILALFKLWWLFRKENFDSVHSLTPKAGLLSMLAAR
ncbi:MAG: hypothetical protein HY226_00145, partial [Candidatus Vogelbacteria bacterium]|nr:hypothetical protein [Candidatus Vogelbacteria bacterium]